MNLAVAHFVASVTPRALGKNTISAPCTWDTILSVITNIHDHTRTWGLEQDRFKNWQLFGVWKLPFCYHRAIKLTQSWICYISPCIYPLVQPSVTCEYHLKVLQLLHLLQCIAAYLQRALAWVSERHITTALSVLISFPLSRTQQKTDQIHAEGPAQMLAAPNRLQKANGWSWSNKPHPPRLGCDCLSNS